MGLTEKLIEILDMRKKRLSGSDIKHIVEAIEISERINRESAAETNKKENERQLKEQQELYAKLGKEYMYGGEE